MDKFELILKKKKAEFELKKAYKHYDNRLINYYEGVIDTIEDIIEYLEEVNDD